MIIDYNHLARLDLNLLVAFDALLTEQHVTRAASRLGIGQSAMSHNLGRLRKLFRDDLFVRSESGMQPTPRARALALHVRAALSEVQATLRPDGAFDPARAERRFRLGIRDDLEVAMVPPLLAYIARAAPGVSLDVQQLDPERLLESIDDDRLDLAVGVFHQGRTHHKRRVLCRSDGFLCLFPRAAHDPAERLTIAHYASLPHVRVSTRAECEAAIDAALAKRRYQRRILLDTPHAISVPFVLQQLRAMATLPRRTALVAAASLGLATANVPFPLNGYSIAMLWHASYDQDAAHRWLRDTAMRIAGELDAAPPATAATGAR
ncbi:LysR family transcriptional regulator [Pendulispora albinea]|uniref:LysR family transcriptional regulator n=1 Tax=Pendulispora albinea TaxID=2741071 RepID=A0ABZ2M7R6_9BACT